MKDVGYADGTILSTKNHLSTILHRAERLRLVDPFEVATPNVERFDNRVFTDHEAASVYRILTRHPLLQTAFVLALATGARPSDLFSLEWSNVRLTGCPVVRFVAKKTKRTGNRLVVPLMPHVVRHLERLPQRDGWLFPGLGSPTAKNPEHSTVSRNRTSTMKGLMLAASVFDVVDGQQVEIEKPFQVCRSTAATWIERVASGMSSTLLGHVDDDRAARRVTRVHYLPSEMEPCPELVRAVNAVKWPEEMVLK
jgi:integrase